MIPRPTCAGLVLAAGESRRMGSPKALLRYRGESFLDRTVGLLQAHCAPVIVVLGAGADEIRAQAQRPAVFVVNAQYRTGQTSSMQAGLRAVPAHAAGVLFTLVDHPAVSTETVAALAAEPEPGVLVRVPRYRGERGHPIWFSSTLIPEFLALPENGAAREVVRRHRPETRFLDLDDPGILADIDDREAYRALVEARA
ncbi:MAG TPA: nucleotidyltransferase family protein [Bryobacteraceae bacterium]|nr:nucleotidyltransferase family protein [Bryobacteraceae bacterium]